DRGGNRGLCTPHPCRRRRSVCGSRKAPAASPPIATSQSFYTLSGQPDPHRAIRFDAPAHLFRILLNPHTVQVFVTFLDMPRFLYVLRSPTAVRIFFAMVYTESTPGVLTCQPL